MLLALTSLVALLLTAGPVTGVLTLFSGNFSELLSSPGKLFAVISTVGVAPAALLLFSVSFSELLS